MPPVTAILDHVPHRLGKSLGFEKIFGHPSTTIRQKLRIYKTFSVAKWGEIMKF